MKSIICKITILSACLIESAISFSNHNLAFGNTFTLAQTCNGYKSNSAETSTQHFMFGGAGALEEEDEYTPEQQASIDAAAKQLGFSAAEYKLVLKMQKSLGEAVDSLRVNGGDESVSVTMDGNAPPKFLEVEISDGGKSLGKATLEKKILSALKDANEQAKKGQQAAVQKMNTDIAEEMKKMGV